LTAVKKEKKIGFPGDRRLRNFDCLANARSERQQQALEIGELGPYY
jgi:hypothetical protein